MVLLLWLFATQGINADDFESYHLLTLAELETLAERSPDSVSVEFAIVRKLGQSDQARALQRLNAMDTSTWDESFFLIATAYHCEFNIRQGLMAEATPFCESLENENRDTGQLSTVSRAIAYNARGYYFVRRGKAEEALAEFEAAIKLPLMEDQVVLVTLLHNRGVALMLSGLTDLAIQAFEMADQEKSVLASDEVLPTILAYNLGYVQAQAGKHEAALRSYAIVIPWLTQTNQLTRQYIAHTQVALSLSGVGRYNEALLELKPWIERSDIAVSPDSSAQAQLALGQAYLGLERVAEAEVALLKGIEIATSQDNPGRLRELSLVYGKMLLEYNEPAIAIDYLVKFLDQFSTDEFSLELGPAHDLLARAFAKAGQYENAYQHGVLASEAAQRAQSADFARRLASLSVSNEIDVKNQQLDLAEERQKVLQAESQLVRLFDYGAIAIVLTLLVLIAFYYRHRSKVRETEVHKEVAARLQREVEIRTHEVQQVMEQHNEAERERAELELRLANDEKLRLVGQLTGGVAHDFNNLLTVIQLSAELLLLDLAEEQKKLAEDILTASDSGKAITGGLLAYARQQVLQPVLVDLVQFFSSNRQMFQRTANGTVEFTTEMDTSESLLIRVDPGQLVSAMLNLILNAGEASKEGALIEISVTRQDKSIVISVADNGRGMSPEEVKAATEPFYSTKGPAEGSGLGLAMVEGFMNQSGGQLEIRSVPGEGTTVNLFFSSEVAVGAPVETALAYPEFAGGETILLVEDEEQIREVGKMALENAGYLVHLAQDGDDAVNRLNELGEIDLLISDLKMPGSLSGDQLIRLLRQTHPTLPVLMITGYSATVPSEYPILVKPFRLQDLLTTVRTLLREGNPTQNHNSG